MLRLSQHPRNSHANPKSLLCACLVVLLRSALAQSTAFNYQGQLSDGTSAATGIYDMRFAIFDASPNGNPVGAAITQNAVEVRGGVFNVTLDFGADVFKGPARWLEIGVRTNGDSVFTTLSPRQPLLPTPYAITAANLSGTLGATQLNGVLPSSALAGDYGAILNFNNESNHYAGDGTALKFGGFGYCALPCYWNLNGNAGTAPGQNFIGTTDNTPLEFRVNGQRALRLEPTTNSPNVIGGFEGNSVGSGGAGNTIGGGGSLYAPNRLSTLEAPPSFSTISGGAGNRIYEGHFATIAGGNSNSILMDRGFRSPVQYDTIGGGFANAIREGGSSTIAGGTANYIVGDTGNRVRDSVIGGGNGNSISSDGLEQVFATTIAGGEDNRVQRSSYATIIGGQGNRLGVYSDLATIAGGLNNTISSRAISASIAGGANNTVGTQAGYATVAGGLSNMASGAFSTVPGGLLNMAGDKAFAAGTRAKAVHSGSFVWADAVNEDFASTGTNQFLIRASGGVGIGTPAPQAALHVKGGVIVEGAASTRIDTSSFSAGKDATASGFASTALGDNTTASAEFSTAIGFNASATGARSTAMGSNTRASGLVATAMGLHTTASGTVATALGKEATASSDTSTAMGFRTVASGVSSTAMGSRTMATAMSSTAMGQLSIASGGAATAMGDSTTASGVASVAMGSGSAATNDYTFAGGTHARAEDPGSFVWASGNTNDFPSSTPNRVHFYAAGGLAVEYAGQDEFGRGLKWLVLASQEPGKVIHVYNGAYLSEGGAWTDTSDRNAKENFEPVNTKEVLERVKNLPLTSWNYRSESNAVRHLGPVAQDFHAAFGLGADDKHIAGLDSSGVALAAIQGLSQELRAKEAEIDQLKQRLETLESRLDKLSH